MKSALDVHHLLLARGIHHELVRTATRAVSADDLPRALDVPTTSCVAVHCFTVQDCRTADGSAVHLVAVLLQAGETPDPDLLDQVLQASAVRAATPDEINTHTGFSAAFVSPIGLPEDVLVLADTRLSSSDVLYAAVGEGGLALGIGTRDLLVATGARLAELTPALPGDAAVPAVGAAPQPEADPSVQLPQDATARVIALDDRRFPSRRSAG